MMKRLIPIVAICVVFGITSEAETMRPRFTKENRFPELGHWEIIGLLGFGEFIDNDEQLKTADGNFWTLAAGGRYQATENLALLLEVPVGGISPDEGSSEASIGDIAVGLQLRAHENFFRFPYVIPHAKYAFDTGSTKAGTGDGESSGILGLTIGSKVYDVPWYVNFDVNYELRSDSDNILGLSASVIWEVNTRFSVMGEALATDEEPPGFAEEHPYFGQGALIYHPNDRMTVGVYAGAGKNSPRDIFTSLRIAYDL